MSTPLILLGAFLALLAGCLIQQTIETLINTSLTLLPFNIQTI